MTFFNNLRSLRGSTAIAIVAGAVSIGPGTPIAMAQDAATNEEDTTTLPTIVVTGEKFGRDQFTTFTSVEVFTGGELHDLVRPTLNDALNSPPNIRSFLSGEGNSDIVIRGLSSEGVTAPSRSNPVISVVVDGAEQGVEATRRGTRGVWDVEQVEVLRGPQSTTQGRNALAGSVVIKTKDPTYTPEASFEGVTGTDKYRSGAFAVSAPIVKDELAFRIAGQVFRGENGIDYVDPSISDVGENEFEEIRGKLLWEPAEWAGFKGLFTVSRTHDKPAWGAVSGPDFFARRFDATTAERRDTYVNRYIADLSYEFNEDWKIQSITSFVDTDVDINSPRTSTLTAFQFIRDDTREGGDFSQDIRLTYGSEDSQFSGVFGVFAGRSTFDLDSNIQAVADPSIPFILPFQLLQAKNESETVALYADTRYEFVDRWTLLSGGRLVHDKVSANYTGSLLDISTFGYVPLTENNSVSNTEFLPKIGLAFELDENQNLAATATKGYRPGFSELVIGTTTVNKVDPETLWAYELAYRSKWLEDRLQVNGNIFYYDYKNQQVPLEFDPRFPGQTISLNAAESHSYGAELDIRYSFDNGLELFGGLGLMKTKFDKGDFAGNEFPEAPSLTASFGGIYKHESGLFAGGDVSFTDGYYSKGDVNNLRSLDSFTVLNANIGYEKDNFKITAFAQNLLDEEYLTSIATNGQTATVGEGRSFGIRVNATF
ncbi:TonB-dependent receptor [Rhizobium sp. Leaf311]|uniref:TonB-dependent receptor n=1 Tax=Rhizobium sp. Leaf311 TaxID=1736332 RepID=UPI0007137759|nr:TonB-dependent receptor [Rhizobium sp. Leaf311]KQQ46109.1 TonB-dependent receptor [Rhizobium sp. Leaf311]